MVRTIDVDGMSCGGCEQNIVETLEDVLGVSDASADHEAGTTSVEGDANDADLVAAVENVGYDVSA